MDDPFNIFYIVFGFWGIFAGWLMIKNKNVFAEWNKNVTRFFLGKKIGGALVKADPGYSPSWMGASGKISMVLGCAFLIFGILTLFGIF